MKSIVHGQSLTVKSLGRPLTASWWILVAGFLVLQTGCAQEFKVHVNPRPSQAELDEEIVRVSKEATPHSVSGPVSAGSLWPADGRASLYGDHKAFRVGDVLTVSVSESAKASNTANTDLARNTSNKAQVSALWGLQDILSQTNLTKLDVTTDSSHKGAGATARTGQLTASLTAVVKDVLPNGNLVIQGTRSVLVNHEEQYMTLTGVVRPEDIGRDNMVFSTQIADARISFGGIGVVADKQRSGWATWAFDWLFPF